MYQQGKCGPQRAKSITNYMEVKRMNVMKWPYQSPDLNSFENGCAMVKKKLCVRPTYPTNVIDLFDLLHAEWMSIPDEYFTELQCSMHTRISLDNLNRGKTTKY